MGYRDTYFNKNDAYDNNNGWYTCQKCGRKFRKGDMDIDHIIPQKFGGSSSEWNLQCICKHCNRSKQASMSDTPRDLFNSGKRILKREAVEAKMIWDLFFRKELIVMDTVLKAIIIGVVRVIIDTLEEN